MSFIGEVKVDTNVKFPIGLRVLVVDPDLRSREEIRKMSITCGYKVTTVTKAVEALSIITGSRFDIVISDINIADMDPFQFIKIVSVERKLPFVVVSADDDNNTVLKGLSSGACDYLLKPVQLENIKFIWKHVIRNQKRNIVENCQKALSLDGEIVNATDRENGIVCCSDSGIAETEDDDILKDKISQKKQRIVWTRQLHEKFITIVNQMGVKNAVPKKILEMMNNPDLTRENVASHLQKYRLYLKKMDASMQQKRHMQSQAINLELNFQKNGYYNNQISLQNYGVPESRFGLQAYNSVTHKILSHTISPEADQTFPLDRFSGFRIGDSYDIGNLDSSLAIQRPTKRIKQTHVEADEETATFPSTANDVPTSLSSQFSELPSFQYFT